MLKINLSGEKDDNPGEKSAEETLVTAAQETESGDAQAAQESPEKKTSGGRSNTRLLLLVALLAVSVLAYTQKDAILGLFAAKEPVVQEVAPTPPPTAPKPEPVPQEPDPVFVVLNSISNTVPTRVWLTSMVVTFDGKYEIKGISFSHDAIGTMIASLGTAGTVASSTVPPKAKSAESKYDFGVAGALANVKVPDILDAIPADKLSQMAAAVKGKAGEYGVEFRALPKEGATYSEQDMPFNLQGSYEGLKKVVADLCPEGGDVKVYRLVITPDAPGRTFDKVRAMFSLRTVSAI